jgi:3-dehydroquinate dehydratase-2
MKILVINGPNLNFLGIRDKKVYGEQSYDHLVQMIQDKAERDGIEAECYQSNHEGDLIDRIQAAYSDGTDGIVINPGALTHYSYALYDALGSYDTIPMVEVHISDINTRDEFRRISVTAPACDLQIVGHGLDGYLEAMDFIREHK